jgi:hypothetical protein
MAGMFSSGGGLTSAQAALQTGAGFSMAGGGYLGEDIFGVGRSSGRSYEFHRNEVILGPDNIPSGADRNRGAMVVNVHNYTGAGVQTSKNSQGELDIIIGAVAQDMVNGGPTGQAALQVIHEDLRFNGTTRDMIRGTI